jgi:hypothetical protein
MQKVYLLLRNNQKTGPYSLDELLQLQLKPFDLVWVEGRSAGWRYPGEIDSLKPYMADVPTPATPFEPIATAALEKETYKQPARAIQPSQTKKVFVSMPGKPRPVYKPVEEEQPVQKTAPVEPGLRMETQTISPYAPGYVPPPKEENIQTKYSRALNDVEDDYTKWIVQNRRKKKSLVNSKSLLLTALIIALSFGGYYFLKPSSNSVIPSQVTTSAQTTATSDQPSASNETNASPELNQPVVKQSGKKKAGKKIQTTKAVATVKENTIKNRMPVTQDHRVEKAVVVKGNNDEENVVVKEESKAKPVAETPTKEKKKKLGEVLKGIFSKKEKKPAEKTETVLEDPRPATNRQSQRREDSAAPAGDASSSQANVDISDQIDLTSNAPDNWMMGVKGLKITLRNRSSLPIQSAAVDVFYYDENNRTLEKKTLSFTNVSAKGKLTLAAPDNKWADHVDFKLGGVVLKDDRFAKN